MLAAAGGSTSTASSSKQQYCPPNSPGAGQPQGGPGNNCGNPPDKCPNGNPKPPDGNCGNNPGGPPEKPPKKGKKARFHVKRHPAKRCYAHKIKLNVSVNNRGKGQKVSVYKDGHKVRSTGKNTFTVTWKVGRLSPGVHTVKLRVKGSDGKWRTRTVTFRRC